MQDLFSNVEELKDHELHNASTNTLNEFEWTVVSIVLVGFKGPITVISSGKFEEFEDFWMASTIDQQISNFLKRTKEDS